MTNRAFKRYGINSAKKSLIHVARAQLGWDDDTYRDMLHAIAGVRSAKDVPASRFDAVMKEFERCGFTKVHGDHEFTGYTANLKKWQGIVGKRPGMATPAQLAKIDTEWGLMAWYWAADGFGNRDLALRNHLNKITHVSDLRFLNFDQAVQFITVIEKIKDGRKRV